MDNKQENKQTQTNNTITETSDSIKAFVSYIIISTPFQKFFFPQ